MRAIAMLSFFLFLAGCASHHEQPYVYTPPVVIVLKSLQHTNDHAIAVFTMSNVGSWSMWYTGEDQDHPAYCMEYKGMMYSLHTMGDSMGGFWGDTGLGRYELAPGQSRDFIFGRKEFSGPFRVGVWLGEYKDTKRLDDLIWWSAYVDP